MISLFTVIVFSIVLTTGSQAHSENETKAQLVPAEDLTSKFVVPIDVANQMLTDLEQQVQQIIKRGEEVAGADGTHKQTTSNSPQLAYSDPATVNSKIEQSEHLSGSGSLAVKAGQSTQEEENNLAVLLGNLGELDKKLQGTFQDLQTRRRFVLGAMIRQMQSTVRQIRSNVARLQTQLSTIESVATQMSLLRPIVSHFNGSSVPDQTMANVNANRELVEQIEQRIGAVSRSINDIVTRLSSSLSVGALGSVIAEPGLSTGEVAAADDGTQSHQHSQFDHSKSSQSQSTN